MSGPTPEEALAEIRGELSKLTGENAEMVLFVGMSRSRPGGQVRVTFNRGATEGFEDVADDLLWGLQKMLRAMFEGKAKIQVIEKEHSE